MRNRRTYERGERKKVILRLVLAVVNLSAFILTTTKKKSSYQHGIEIELWKTIKLMEVALVVRANIDD